MTKEEGKVKKRKKLAGNQAGNIPSAQEEESSKQFEEEKEENMQTGTANETGYKGRSGRPRKPLSDVETKIRNEKKIKKDRDKRKKDKFEFNIYKIFCEDDENRCKFKTFLEKRRKSIEKISKFKLEEYKASCGEARITKMLKDKDRKRNDKTSKN
ncbi:hypothetical protein SLEP1_g28133 [Rubroshorea leprosula]|uniref:Uncharacterized protein n=1 Tax=Rubroshorea leprosula TaxID=152421 RepID=A0AAV5K225_9ROSI|nr:hypothetical protein SLEP1_g28133 [Rubroshorea leprosula]